jgi:hypothetical protein
MREGKMKIVIPGGPGSVSRRVVPVRLPEHGFAFTYPDWRGAARDLCRQSIVARNNALAA